MNSCRFNPGVMRLCLAFLCLLWFGALALRAADRYVVPPGTAGGTNEGAFDNWSIAATQIQWAVDVATNTEIVWVSNSTYNLTNQIVITNGINLKGFSGDPRDTIINGNYTPGSATTNNCCLLLSNSAAFVSGVTLSNGAIASAAAGGGGARIYGGIMSNCIVRDNHFFYKSGSVGGGGIYMFGGTVMVSTIHANTATNGTSSAGGGAGINFENAGSLVSGCVISNNTTSGKDGDSAGQGVRGGGVYMNNGARLESSKICNNKYLPANAAFGWGGGVKIVNSTMSGCTVAVNNIGYAGGVDASSGTITNCVISSNSVPCYAGGLYGYVGVGSSFRVYNTLIVGNDCPAGSATIVISAKGEVTMDNCRIIKNKCSTQSSVLHIETLTNIANVSLLNSEVSANEGGIYILRPEAQKCVLRNCLIVNNTNTATASYPRGTGVTIVGPTTNVSISCCTIVGNKNPAGSGAGLRFQGTNYSALVSSCIIYSNGVSGTDDVYDADAPINYGFLQYSCVRTNPGFTGEGIIVADPKFKNIAGGDYRLSAQSPCINTGSNQTWMTNSYDLGGGARVHYGTVDMGAYEVIYNGTVYKF